MHHLHFNHLAILVSALYQWILGALWYSLFFAKPWMALTGHKPGSRPKGAVAGMITSFIGGLMLSLMLAHVVMWSGAAAHWLRRFRRLHLLAGVHCDAAAGGDDL